MAAWCQVLLHPPCKPAHTVQSGIQSIAGGYTREKADKPMQEEGREWLSKLDGGGPSGSKSFIIERGYLENTAHF